MTGPASERVEELKRLRRYATTVRKRDASSASVSGWIMRSATHKEVVAYIDRRLAALKEAPSDER